MSAPDWQSLFAALTRLKSGADIVFRGVSHRGELATLELQAARSELATTGVAIAAGSVAFLLAGLALTLLIAAIFWDTPHRVTAIGWLGGIEIACGAGAWIWARRRWRAWRPLPVTQEQLQRDIQCLKQILQK